MAEAGWLGLMLPEDLGGAGLGGFSSGSGGSFGIGSDSNVLIGIADELRQLETAQRLHRQSRNVLAEPGASTGYALFTAALAGGSQALGRPAPGIAEGGPADLVSLDADHPALIGKSGDALLDAWIFAGGRRTIDCVWRAGTKLVNNGVHIHREAIGRRYRQALEKVLHPS